ncbi:MAG: hypothetical protein IPN26_12695 [Bacteroidetes bacterium]|nr:hypothetical protein [Bacteroidota bacterium]
MASHKNIKKSPAHQPVSTNVAEPIQSNTETKSYWLWSVILIALFALITYWNTAQHGFVLDDVQIIEQNKVTQTGISAENLKTIFTTSHRYGMQGDEEHTLYRPMTKSFFAFFWQWGEGNPQTFHRGNIFYLPSLLSCCSSSCFVFLNNNFYRHLLWHCSLWFIPFIQKWLRMRKV